jgi:hypothetical protein
VESQSRCEMLESICSKRFQFLSEWWVSRRRSKPSVLLTRPLAWNSLTDLFLTALPVTIIWNLNLDRVQKLGISILLSLSLL